MPKYEIFGPRQESWGAKVGGRRESSPTEIFDA